MTKALTIQEALKNFNAYGEIAHEKYVAIVWDAESVVIDNFVRSTTGHFYSNEIVPNAHLVEIVQSWENQGWPIERETPKKRLPKVVPLVPEMSIFDVCPEIGTYVHEVCEINGNKETVATVYDILMDFGKFPADLDSATVSKLARKLAKSYLGK